MINYKNWTIYLCVCALTGLLCLAALSCDIRSGFERGWVRAGGARYYYTKKGKEATGLTKLSDGSYRYFDEKTHQLQTGMVELDGETYYFEPEDGKMSKGFTDVDGATYLFHKKSGKLLYGWTKVSKTRYHLDEKTGEVSKGMKKIDGKPYFFDKKTGSLMTGFFDYDGARYHSDPDSGVLTLGTTRIDGKKYYFDDKTGELLTGLIGSGSSQIYVDPQTGLEANGIVNLNGADYGYSDGVPLRDCRQMISGVLYYFDDNGKVIRSINSADKLLAFTFDDGPSIYTPLFLDALEKNDARATFFVVGNRVDTYKESVIRADQLGCQVGNHTFRHDALRKLSNSGVAETLNNTSAEVEKVIGKPTTIMRPTGGNYSDSIKAVITDLHMPIILWSIDTRDWDHKDADKTYNNVINKVKDGDIILMHDIYKSSAEAVDRLLPELKSQGFTFVTVDELSLLRNKALTPGKAFYDIR